jgi:hypothetical protein
MLAASSANSALILARDVWVTNRYSATELTAKMAPKQSANHFIAFNDGRGIASFQQPQVG